LVAGSWFAWPDDLAVLEITPSFKPVILRDYF
jgi:hypothetical protein